MELGLTTRHANDRSDKAMTIEQPSGSTAEQDRQYHTYTTHRIPWYIRMMWIAYWIAAVWYVIKYAIPTAKNYF